MRLINETNTTNSDKRTLLKKDFLVKKYTFIKTLFVLKASSGPMKQVPLKAIIEKKMVVQVADQIMIKVKRLRKENQGNNDTKNESIKAATSNCQASNAPNKGDIGDNTGDYSLSSASLKS